MNNNNNNDNININNRVVIYIVRKFKQYVLEIAIHRKEIIPFFSPLFEFAAG